MAHATPVGKGKWKGVPNPGQPSAAMNSQVVGAASGGSAKHSIGNGKHVVHPHTMKQTKSVVTEQGLKHGPVSSDQSLPIHPDNRY